MPPEPNPAADAFQATMTRDERQRSSVYTTAETILEAYADPGVLAHSEQLTSRRPSCSTAARTLYLSATVREQRRLRPVFVTLLEAVIEEAYSRPRDDGRPLDPPLLIVLDEAANIAPLPDLDVIASTGAGHGVQLVTVLQDLAQAHDRWGRERAETIVNNHRAKLIGAGTADSRTLDYAARLLGDADYRQQSSSVTQRQPHRDRGLGVPHVGATARDPPGSRRLGAADLRERAASVDRPPAVVRRARASALARGESATGRG